MVKLNKKQACGCFMISLKYNMWSEARNCRGMKEQVTAVEENASFVLLCDSIFFFFFTFYNLCDVQKTNNAILFYVQKCIFSQLVSKS